MAQANAIFLSLFSGASLLLAAAPGCSNSASPAAAAVIWHVTPGAAGGGSCSTVDDTFSVGDSTSSPIKTATDGTPYNGVPITVQCDVASTSTGYNVNAYLKYGEQASLTVQGAITASGSGQPGPQTGIKGQFSDFIGLRAAMTDNNCTVTFTPNTNQGIAATRIWGVIDCPNEAATPTQQAASQCDGHAEFLFENCGQ